MKKILAILNPTFIAVTSLLMVTLSLRYYLYIHSAQLIKEFRNQNFKEIYSSDSLNISSKLNSLSSAINWICIEGKIGDHSFYKMNKGSCGTGLFQQYQELYIPEANNIKISFTLRLPKEVEIFFALFLALQILLIFTLIHSIRRSEQEKLIFEMHLSKIARQMSHDIRSPLATLNTALSNLTNLSEEDHSLMTMAIARINSIANNLLFKSKQNSSYILEDTIPQIVDTELSVPILEILKEKVAEYQENDISISFNPPSELICSKIDVLEIKRIISNLINNAIEARRNNHVLKIILRLYEEANEAVLEVNDNGKGISSEIIKKIGLEEFTTKKNGNGLGLIHTFDTIKRWGGHITIDSKIDAGTNFKIYLPIVKNRKNITILLDDDELVRLTWTSSAKKRNVNFLALSNLNELKDVIKNIALDSHFFLDSQLGEGVSGERIAQDLHAAGFTEIYITSGFESKHFSHLKFLKGIRDKSPPW